MWRFYEFFAGGGMVRAGLGEKWNCAFANDFDLKKSEVYKRNWPDAVSVYKCCDIRDVGAEELPGKADLVWASFPCQDLSLAGAGAGLKGERSGTFWPFWKRMEGLGRERRPRLICLENVCGTLSSHGGADFAAICEAFDELGYAFGALVIDAKFFVPQSRPRLFVIGAHRETTTPMGVTLEGPAEPWHTTQLRRAEAKLPASLRSRWVWWGLPVAAPLDGSLAKLIDFDLSAGAWRSREETRRLSSMMSPVNRAKVEERKRLGGRHVGTLYRRTRPSETGGRAQRVEVRFDDIAGCLRTPAGGSSRQSIIVVDNGDVKIRLLTTREAARLMGLSDAYELPYNYNEAYHLVGDGVVTQVVKHLANNLFEPILNSSELAVGEAA